MVDCKSTWADSFDRRSWHHKSRPKENLSAIDTCSSLRIVARIHGSFGSSNRACIQVGTYSICRYLHFMSVDVQSRLSISSLLQILFHGSIALGVLKPETQGHCLDIRAPFHTSFATMYWQNQTTSDGKIRAGAKAKGKFTGVV